MAVIKDLQLRISAAVKEYIKGNENIDVHGLSYDKDGIESGYDYSEVYLHSISDVTFSVHFVDEISENKSIVTLSCKADISADCYYEDYANAPWDPEEKEYVFVDTIQMREEHAVALAAVPVLVAHGKAGVKGCNFAIISHVHNLLCVHVCVIYT